MMKKNNFVGKIFITKNFEETQQLGLDFAKVLEKGDVIALYGVLGSGKTTFVQGVARGLGIKRRIISPTFIIIRDYKIRMNDKGLMINEFYHIDLYRVESERDLVGLGLEEIINDPQNIVAIEWAQNLKNLLPAKRIKIKFFYEKDNKRKIIFRSSDQQKV